MKEILVRLALIPKIIRDALLAPAQDPRAVSGTGYYPIGAWSGEETSQLDRTGRMLEKGFSEASSEAGLGALRQLEHEYRQLAPLMQRSRATDPLAGAQLPALVEETHRQGLSVLEDALELARTVNSADVDKLEGQAAQLELETRSLSENGEQDTRLKLRREALATHRELLEMIVRQTVRLEELLHQSQRCQTSLQRTRIELATLRADRSAANVDSVTDSLRKTISQARGVQDEMKRLGY